MPRHETLSDEAIEVRSVLMRLHHSRQMGEAFYPAAFVNGHAPQMEADGWIERCGQGWRLTDVGLKVWARMNPELIAHKFQSNKQFFEEMRHVLRGEDQMRQCSVEGCEQPRMISKRGEVLTRCEFHQREYWREQAAKKEAKKKANQSPSQPSPASDGGRPVDKVYPPIGTVVSVDINDLGEQVATMEMKSVYLSVPEAHDCETCEAKAIIEALKSKSPKLAALIEAMEAEQKAASELGL